jgi:hypothetical protein
MSLGRWTTWKPYTRHAASVGVVGLLASGLLAACSIGAQSRNATLVAPSGLAVIDSMRAAYDGRWYRTLRFTQKTTRVRPDGTQAVDTWYESLMQDPARGTLLRIDFGNPAAGDGVLYTADSSFVVRKGALTERRGDGNPFLPLIEGVYVQPVSVSTRQIRALGVDLARTQVGSWEGKSVWIVGTDVPGDSTTAQFWVEQDRKVVTRAIVRFSPTRPPFDLHLGKYERAGQGWLATRVVINSGGKPVQSEDYSQWVADPALSPELFDLARWSTAPHWVGKP